MRFRSVLQKPEPDSQPLALRIRTVHLSIGEFPNGDKIRTGKSGRAQPEAFVVVAVDFGEGAMKSISEGMSEKKMRKYLAWQGATHQEVDEAIDRAKKEPAT